VDLRTLEKETGSRCLREDGAGSVLSHPVERRAWL